MEEFINKPLASSQAYINAGKNPPPPQLIQTSHPPPAAVVPGKKLSKLMNVEYQCM